MASSFILHFLLSYVGQRKMLSKILKHTSVPQVWKVSSLLYPHISFEECFNINQKTLLKS